MVSPVSLIIDRSGFVVVLWFVVVGGLFVSLVVLFLSH